MGGFVLEAADLSAPIPVDAEQLLYLLKRKHVDYPTLSKEDINDKNKADGLARLVECYYVIGVLLTNFIGS